MPNSAQCTLRTVSFLKHKKMNIWINSSLVDKLEGRNQGQALLCTGVNACEHATFGDFLITLFVFELQELLSI